MCDAMPYTYTLMPHTHTHIRFTHTLMPHTLTHMSHTHTPMPHTHTHMSYTHTHSSHIYTHRTYTYTCITHAHTHTLHMHIHIHHTYTPIKHTMDLLVSDMTWSHTHITGGTYTIMVIDTHMCMQTQSLPLSQRLQLTRTTWTPMNGTHRNRIHPQMIVRSCPDLTNLIMQLML